MRTPNLSVYVLTRLNRSALVHGREAMIWPCLGRTERDEQAAGAQFVTVEDSMSIVHMSRGSNKPASPQLKSEPAIVAGLAKAALGETSVDWDALVADYDRIRDNIEATIPGFERFNERVREPGGFVLRNTAAHREWKTDSGRWRSAWPPHASCQTSSSGSRSSNGTSLVRWRTSGHVIRIATATLTAAAAPRRRGTPSSCGSVRRALSGRAP